MQQRTNLYEYDEEKHIEMERRDAKLEAEKETKEKINQLNLLLAEQNRIEDIMKAAKDSMYQEKLLEEFKL